MGPASLSRGGGGGGWVGGGRDYYLADGDDERWQDEDGHGHPGDVGLEAPRLRKLAPTVVLSRGQLGAGEDEHLERERERERGKRKK